MNDIYKIAIIIARIARAYIEVQGMKTKNKQRELDGSSLAYSEEHFCYLINENNLNDDDIKELFNMSQKK